MRSALLACLAITAFLPACGTMEDESDGPDIAITKLDGLDAPADSAGGHFVRNKGTLTVGGSKSGALTGHDVYHGYTIAAKRGDTLRLRGVTPMYMAIVAVYGPQAADGAWGAQLTKKWSYRPTERKIPSVDYAVTKAGKYLAVFGIPQRDTSGSASDPYSLSACDGDCVAGGCLEFATKGNSNYGAINLLNRAEAEVVSHAVTIPAGAAVVHSGSCGSQSKACPREHAPVCGQMGAINGNTPATYSNICLAQVAQRTSMGDKLGPSGLYAPAGACHP